MKFLDLFAGIGGFRLGMESQGHKCLGFCEIDKFARTSYKAMFNTEGEIEYHDIKEVTDQTLDNLEASGHHLRGISLPSIFTRRQTIGI
jgi:site-specific DNA-cytosine methylase